MKLKKRSQVGQISDMDMRLLRVFKAVVDCGGMAAAGGTMACALATDLVVLVAAIIINEVNA